MNDDHQYTSEQVTKLECDSHGFLEASKFAADYIEREKAKPLSTIRTSMETVMLTNLGLAFELKLKALHVKSNGSILKTHSLTKLFHKLPLRIRSELERIYTTVPVFEFTAYRLAKQKPDPPHSQHFDNLSGFLAYLDKIGLYDRRYSFEGYSTSEWWIEITPEAMFNFMGKITEFSNGLAVEKT